MIFRHTFAVVRLVTWTARAVPLPKRSRKRSAGHEAELLVRLGSWRHRQETDNRPDLLGRCWPIRTKVQFYRIRSEACTNSQQLYRDAVKLHFGCELASIFQVSQSLLSVSCLCRQPSETNKQTPLMAALLLRLRFGKGTALAGTR